MSGYLNPSDIHYFCSVNYKYKKKRRQINKREQEDCASILMLFSITCQYWVIKKIVLIINNTY